jgi:hypothetical protein
MCSHTPTIVIGTLLGSMSGTSGVGRVAVGVNGSFGCALCHVGMRGTSSVGRVACPVGTSGSIACAVCHVSMSDNGTSTPTGQSCIACTPTSHRRIARMVADHSNIERRLVVRCGHRHIVRGCCRKRRADCMPIVERAACRRVASASRITRYQGAPGPHHPWIELAKSVPRRGWLCTRRSNDTNLRFDAHRAHSAVHRRHGSTDTRGRISGLAFAAATTGEANVCDAPHHLRLFRRRRRRRRLIRTAINRALYKLRASGEA